MTAERTALESALIPVTAYILIACIECYRRYPEHDAARSPAPPSPEEIGAAGRSPGNQIDAVHLWSIANIPLLGRQMLAPFGLVDVDRDVPALGTVLDFWEPRCRRVPRRRGAAGVGRRVASCRATGPTSSTSWSPGRAPVGDDGARAPDPQLNASLTSFLFLLYFDTRAGYQDTGPYPLADGRVAARARLQPDRRRATSRGAATICAELPHSNLTFALVLDGGVRRHHERLGHLDHRSARLLRPPRRGRRVHRRRRHAHAGRTGRARRHARSR